MNTTVRIEMKSEDYLNYTLILLAMTIMICIVGMYYTYIGLLTVSRILAPLATFFLIFAIIAYFTNKKVNGRQNV